MVSEAKKLYLIEEILKINSDATLSAVEAFIKNKTKPEKQIRNNGFAEFSGIWTKEEADEIEKIIADSCEVIHPDDWK